MSLGSSALGRYPERGLEASSPVILASQEGQRLAKKVPDLEPLYQVPGGLL